MANSELVGGKKEEKQKRNTAKRNEAGIHSRPNITARRDEAVLVKSIPWKPKDTIY